ncbi:MAG: hypothetical protein KBE52_04385 [Bilophila sp.]|nr:hypothetical protein [Bilophila sp.]
MTKTDEKAAPPARGATSKTDAQNVPQPAANGQGVSRLDFFRGCALAGIIAASKNRRQVFSACVGQGCDTVQMADMLARTMLRRASPFGRVEQ